MSSRVVYRLGAAALLISAPIGLLGHLLLHPPEHGVEDMLSPMWTPAHALIAAWMVFVLLGLPAFHGRQALRAGRIGLTGYVGVMVAGILLVGAALFEALAFPVFAATSGYHPLAALDGPLLGGAFGIVQSVTGTILGIALLLIAIGTWRAAVFGRSSAFAFAAAGVGVLSFPLWLALDLPLGIGITLAVTTLALAWPGWQMLAFAGLSSSDVRNGIKAERVSG